MAERKITATAYTCDGCGRVFIVEENEEMARGYHGRVTHLNGAGGENWKWYACRSRCIGKAIRTAEKCSELA